MSRSCTWLPRVVIVGAGFGGLTAAKALAEAPFDVTLIDRRNYHLFQPLLYQVATAALSPADIAAPIRGILRHAGELPRHAGKGHRRRHGSKQCVMHRSRRRSPYDHLILATGARHAYFGHDEWEAHAPGLKKIEDATEPPPPHPAGLRARRDGAKTLSEQRRLLTFVVVGRRPDRRGDGRRDRGARRARRSHRTSATSIRDRRAYRPGRSRAARLLRFLRHTLSELRRRSPARARRRSACSNSPVTDCNARGVDARRRADRQPHHRLGGRRARFAGRQWLGAETDRAGPVMVERGSPRARAHEHLRHRRHRACEGPRTARHLPGVATVAKQQGRYVARGADAAARTAKLAVRSATAIRASWRRSGEAAPSPRSAG